MFILEIINSDLHYLFIYSFFFIESIFFLKSFIISSFLHFKILHFLFEALKMLSMAMYLQGKLQKQIRLF